MKSLCTDMKVLSSITRKFHLPFFCTPQQNSNKAMSLKLQRNADFKSSLLFPGYEESGCGLITPEDEAHSYICTSKYTYIHI